MRRFIVTGIGSVNPLGADIETSWRNLLAGKSGADPLTVQRKICRVVLRVR